MGGPLWRRLSEERSGSAKSVFHFNVPGSVAKSTHAGLPWLRFIRQRVLSARNGYCAGVDFRTFRNLAEVRQAQPRCDPVDSIAPLSPPAEDRPDE